MILCYSNREGFFCLFSFNWTFPSNDQIAYYISQFLKKSKRNKGLQQQQTLQLNQAVEQSCVVLFWVTQISAFKLFQKCWHFHAMLCIPSKMLAQLAHRPWTQQTARWRVGFRTSLLYLEFVSKLSTLTSWCSGRPPPSVWWKTRRHTGVGVSEWKSECPAAKTTPAVGHRHTLNTRVVQGVSAFLTSLCKSSPPVSSVNSESLRSYLSLPGRDLSVTFQIHWSHPTTAATPVARVSDRLALPQTHTVMYELDQAVTHTEF